MKTRVAILAATFLALTCTREERLLNEQPTPATVQFSDVEARVLYQMRGKNNRIDFDEAAQLALSAANTPSSGASYAKSMSARRIGSVKTLCVSPQNSGNAKQYVSGEGATTPDTLAYVFNFEDNGGFAIVAADTRVETPLLAFCDYGSLGDTIDNPGLALFLEGATYYIERSIVEAERLRDSLLADIIEKVWEHGNVDIYYPGDNSTNKPTTPEERLTCMCEIEPCISYSYGDWQVSERVGPLLPVEWDQGTPFNNSVPKSCPWEEGYGYKAPAGCTAIAVAQLMAYWRHPATLDGINLDWNLLRSYTAKANRYNGVGSIAYDTAVGEEANRFKAQVAHLVQKIGAGVGMIYTCCGSVATPSDGVEFLRDKGYTYGVSWPNNVWELGFSYNEGKMVSSLNSRRPVLMEGFSSNANILGVHFNRGHTWVVDGYMKRRRLVTVTVKVSRSGLLDIKKISGLLPPTQLPPSCINTITTSSHYEYSPVYLHNNWGWGDDFDGQYSNGDKKYTNGYYLSGCFNSNLEAISSNSNAPAKSSSAPMKSTDNHNYQYGIEIYPNIYK